MTFLGAKIRINSRWKFPFHPSTHGIPIHQVRTEARAEPPVCRGNGRPGFVRPLDPLVGREPLVLLRPPKSSGLLVETCSRQRPATLSLMVWGPGCHGGVHTTSRSLRWKDACMGSLVTTMAFHGLSHGQMLGLKHWRSGISITSDKVKSSLMSLKNKHCVYEAIKMWKSEEGPHPLLRSCQWSDGLALLARIVGRWAFVTQVVISFWFLQLFGVHFLHRKCLQSCDIFWIFISFLEFTYSKRNSKYLLFVGVR